MSEPVIVELDSAHLGKSDPSIVPLQSERFARIPGIVHGVTRRVPGLGKAAGNVGLSAPRDQADAWAMRMIWANAIGFDPASIVGLSQVHGAEVQIVNRNDAARRATPGSNSIGPGDALITRESGVTLMTLHADCLPILVVDLEIPAVAAIHSGWRGTVEDVPGATVRAMQAQFGSEASKLLAFFGPSIGPCCYTVGTEVIEAWDRAVGEDARHALVRSEDGCSLDLRAANHLLLTRAGVTPENIEVSDICTKCNGDDWFSHRGQGPNTGRFGAFIALSGSQV